MLMSIDRKYVRFFSVFFIVLALVCYALKFVTGAAMLLFLGMFFEGVFWVLAARALRKKKSGA